MYGEYTKNPQDKCNRFYLQKGRTLNEKVVLYGCLAPIGAYAVVGLLLVLFSVIGK